MLGIIVYSVYMYADFSGGIDIVEGVSELFGIQMAQNFRQPYFSVSLSDFWCRWHMSLGAWMRDYVLYPFALLTPLQSFGKWATKRMGRHAGRTLPACIANIVVFLCVGLWHGAEWHYVLWGLYNGIIVALVDLLAPAFAGLARMLHVNRESKSFHVFAVVSNFLVVQAGRYFDCITNIGALGICLHNAIFNFNSVPLATALAARGIQRATILACSVVFDASLLYEKGHDVRSELLAARLPVRAVAYALCFVLVVLAFPYTVTNGGVFDSLGVAGWDCGGDPGPRKGCSEDRMYSTEQRRLAIETYIKFDPSAADTVAEPGCPTRHSLGAWYKDYLEHGEVRPPKRQREPKFAMEMGQAAVDCCLAHGKSLARTIRRMGHPASRERLCDRTGGPAPGKGDAGGCPYSFVKR